MNNQLVPDWKIRFLKGGCQALRRGVYECTKYLNRHCTRVQIVDTELAQAIQIISAEKICIIRHLFENYRKIMKKQLKEIQKEEVGEKSSKEKLQLRKKCLLETKCGTTDYGIEEIESKVLENLANENKTNTAKQIYEESGREEIEETESMEIESLAKNKIDISGHLVLLVKNSSTLMETEDIFSSRWAPSNITGNMVRSNRKREKIEFTTEISTSRKEGPVEKRARTKTQKSENIVKEE